MNIKILIATFPLWISILILIIIAWVIDATETYSSHNTTSVKILSRKRRFLAFPEGATMAAAICMTHGIITEYLLKPPYKQISISTNWGFTFNLPNATWIIHQIRKQSLKPKQRQIILRRNRRELYNNIETIIDSMGYNGKDCILRALCESAQFFTRKTKKTMLEEIVRTIFSLPKIKLFSFEPSDFEEYDEAYRTGDKIDDCSLIYDGCNFSLLDLAFGKYSEPPPSHLPQPKFSSTYDPLATPVKFN